MSTFFPLSDSDVTVPPCLSDVIVLTSEPQTPDRNGSLTWVPQTPGRDGFGAWMSGRASGNGIYCLGQPLLALLTLLILSDLTSPCKELAISPTYIHTLLHILHIVHSYTLTHRTSLHIIHSYTLTHTLISLTHLTFLHSYTSILTHPFLHIQSYIKTKHLFTYISKYDNVWLSTNIISLSVTAIKGEWWMLVKHCGSGTHIISLFLMILTQTSLSPLVWSLARTTLLNTPSPV